MSLVDLGIAGAGRAATQWTRSIHQQNTGINRVADGYRP
jgi:hypothetical protein